MPYKKYLRNAEEKLQVVKYSEKHDNAAAAKHYETDESNIRYWSKQKLVLAAMPAKKTKNQIKLSNGFVKAGITEKTTTNEIATENESDTEDIASDTETLPDELMDMIDGIGFSSESESDL